jgi:protein phosphatase
MTHTVKKKFLIDSYALSDSGLARDNNEDAWGSIPELNFFMIADGMGGHNAGEIAASEAVSSLEKIIRKRLKRSMELQPVQNIIHDSIEEVNLLVHAKAHSRAEYRGMGTTLCCLHFHPEGVVLGHVGDSRIYLFRKGKLVQLTRDDSLMMDLVDRGRMQVSDREQFSSKHIITKAIGTEPVIDPTVQIFDFEQGDQWLMCTDGLSDCVSVEKMESILQQSHSLKESVQRLIEEANLEGGHDNITVVQMQVQNVKNLS